MNEEATTNLLNVVRHIERCRVADSESWAEHLNKGSDMARYFGGRQDGYQLAGSILRNMLLSMGIAIPEDV